MKAYYWKTPCWKKISKRWTRRIKTACVKLEPRPEWRAACWNYLHKKYAPRMRREYKKGCA